jgi:hypothetical protein
MRLTREEAVRWCAERGVEARLERFATLGLAGSVESIWIRVPPEDRRSVALACVLLMSEVEDDLEESFAGGLLWLTDWDIWSEITERVGLLLLAGLRGGADPRESPAELFEAARLPAAQAALTLPLLFQWDAWFVPSVPRWAAAVSHHGHVDVVADSDARLAALFERFQQGGWEPTLRTRE